MRFCMITTFYPPFHFGGDAVFVYRLAHLLADHGHEVDVIHSEDAYRLLSKDGPREGFPGHPGVKVTGLSTAAPVLDLLAVQQAGRPFRHRRFLTQTIRAGGYDAVHFHNISLMGGPSILTLRPNGGAPTLMTMHEHWLVCPMHVLWRYDDKPCDERDCLKCQVHGRRPPQWWRYSSLRDRSVEALDVVFAPSRFTQQKHAEFGMRRATELLPHFVPDPGPAVAPRPSERSYFLFVGRLERIKGVHTLLEAFAQVSDADLWIAGDGTERSALQAQASGMPNVRFLGSVTPAALPALYAGATAALVPSLCYEVFGLIAVEALAAGTPIIVRNRGPLPEIVEQSGAGFVYDNREELLRRIRGLLDEPEQAQQLKQTARDAYLGNYTPEAHLDRYLDTIRAATGRRQASRS